MTFVAVFLSLSLGLLHILSLSVPTCQLFPSCSPTAGLLSFLSCPCHKQIIANTVCCWQSQIYWLAHRLVNSLCFQHWNVGNVPFRRFLDRLLWCWLQWEMMLIQPVERVCATVIQMNCKLNCKYHIANHQLTVSDPHRHSALLGSRATYFFHLHQSFRFCHPLWFDHLTASFWHLCLGEKILSKTDVLVFLPKLFIERSISINLGSSVKIANTDTNRAWLMTSRYLWHANILLSTS